MSTRTFVFTAEERRMLIEVLGAEKDQAETKRLMTRPDSPMEKAAADYLARVKALREKLL